MFGFLRRRRDLKNSVADIDDTFLRTFAYLSKAANDPEKLTQRMAVVTALAATMGAIRDVYPGAPIEEENLATALIEANAARNYADADALVGAVVRLVRRCPDRREARIDTILLILAPNYMKNRQR